MEPDEETYSAILYAIDDAVLNGLHDPSVLVPVRRAVATEWVREAAVRAADLLWDTVFPDRPNPKSGVIFDVEGEG